ncbi:MAG: addiction module protein [Armatimonadetes bacterium]|nr:addiction module protein [Armatimonadota bacterium]
MIDNAFLSWVKDLSAADRIELIGLVWQTLELGDLPVTELERATLDARIDDETRNPHDASPWSEVEARLRQRPS